MRFGVFIRPHSKLKTIAIGGRQWVLTQYATRNTRICCKTANTIKRNEAFQSCKPHS